MHSGSESKTCYALGWACAHLFPLNRYGNNIQVLLLQLAARSSVLHTVLSLTLAD